MDLIRNTPPFLPAICGKPLKGGMCDRTWIDRVLTSNCFLESQIQASNAVPNVKSVAASSKCELHNWNRCMMGGILLLMERNNRRLNAIALHQNI